MRIRKIVAGAVVLVVGNSALAQGLFDFDDIPGVSQEPAVAIDINPIMMGWIRGIARQADPEAADMLSGLRSIRLRVYHDGNNTRQFNNFMDEVTEELEGSGWMSVIRAQDETSRVRIHMQMTEQEVSGMTVMMTDGSEAVFINIDGTVSAEDLGAVLAALPTDVLGSVVLPPIASTPAPQQSTTEP